MEEYLCSPTSPLYWFISPNVPPFVYYSHIIAFLTSVILIIYVKKYGPNKLVNNVFTFTLLSFVGWVVPALIFWASNRGDVIMFTWSLDILAEPLVYIGGFYLLYLLVEGRDLAFNKKLLLFILYAPLLLLVPTKYTLSGFDVSTCLSIEGPVALYYTYVVESLMVISIICFAIKKLLRTKIKTERSEIIILTSGIILFLFAFAWGNIVGSFTEDWQLGQFGLFGMPIFAGFLVYSIVKFKTLNVKLIGTQALIVFMWIALIAILFLRTIENVRIIVIITLGLFTILGFLLTRSVKREVEQREKIEKLAKELTEANDKLKELDQMKSEFLGLATHQIRAPLTAIKGYSSMLIEGDFGQLPRRAAESVLVIMKSCQDLINIVNDFLNISRIEQGRMVYEKTIFELADLVKEVVNEQKPNIQKAGLSISLEVPTGLSAKVNVDRDKIKQSIGNIIDNAVKYTLEGGITVSVGTENSKSVIKIKDTGIGIDPSEIGKLFSKFSRTKDANKTNVRGTGIGLYIARKMVVDHGGDIKVFSEGEGKGTTFTIELPRSS